MPSVTRFFNQEQTLYVFFQTYYPEKADKSEKFDPDYASRRPDFLPERSSGERDSAACAHRVDPKSHTASFRISVPLAKLPLGRYTVQAVVIAAGTQHSAFGRAYLAIERAPTVPSAAPGSPANDSPAAPPKPPSQ